LKKAAQVVSFAGNPLITIPLMVEILLLRYGSPKIILEMSIVVGSLMIIALAWIAFQYKKGSYSDFSVSDRRQRFSLYLFIIPLVFIVSYVFQLTGQPEYVYKAFLMGGILMTISYLSNFFIKSSLHSSLNTYLGCAVLLVNSTLGMAVLLLTILIAWSRIILKKHTLNEVISGITIGVIASIGLFIITMHLDIVEQSAL